MKKILISVGALIAFLVGLIVLAVTLTSTRSFSITTAGNTIDNIGVLHRFSDKSHYITKVIGEKKVIEDKNKYFTIDDARTLFLESDEVLLLGKSVAIVDAETLNDLPAATYVSSTSNYLVTHEKQEIDILPKGTIIKVAEGRYLLLDDISLTNGEGINERLENNTLIIKNAADKLLVVNNNKVEELAANDLFIEFDNTNYTLNIEQEVLVQRDEEKLDLKMIKVDMNDDASHYNPKNDTKESSEEDEKKSNTKEVAEQSKEESATSQTNISNNEKEATEKESKNESEEQGAQEGKTESTANSTSDGKTGSSVEGESSDNSESEESSKELDQLEVDYLNNVVDKLNDLNEGPGDIPIVNGEIAVDGNQAILDIGIIDLGNYLEKAEVKIYDEAGEVIKLGKLDTDHKRQRITFSNLEVSQKYQAVVEGAYKSSNGGSQKAIFYRENFVIQNVEIEKEVLSVTKNSAKIRLKVAKNNLDNIDALSLSYKKNSSIEENVKTIDIDVDKLKEQGFIDVTLNDLESNTAYLITIGNFVYDELYTELKSWNLVFETAKNRPEIENLEVDYNADAIGIEVTPKGLSDEDETIRSIRYTVYEESDYAKNGLKATELFVSTVTGTNVYSKVVIPMGSVMLGRYIIAGQLNGNDGQEDFSIEIPASDELKIGVKDMPSVIFDNIETEQDRVIFDYLIVDEDEALVLAASSKIMISLYQYKYGTTVGEALSTINIEERSNLYGAGKEIDSLRSETEYIFVVEASYDLSDGKGEQRSVIGTSDVFETAELQSLEFEFKLESATTNSLTTKVTSKDRVAQLEKMILGIYESETSEKPLETADLSDKLEELDEKGLSHTFENLASNKNYIIKMVEAADSGGNKYPIEGQLSAYTAKVEPEFDTVLAKYDQDKKIISAIAGIESNQEAFKDSQNTIEKLTYTLALASSPDKPLVSKTVTENFDKDIIFDAKDDDFILGEIYVVKVSAEWNDRYHVSEKVAQSPTIETIKYAPQVEVALLARDQEHVKLAISIDDVDTAIVKDSLILEIDGKKQVIDAEKKDITVEVPVNDSAIKITLTGEYLVLSDRTSEKVTFFKKDYRALNEVTEITSNVSVVDKNLEVQVDSPKQDNILLGTVSLTNESKTVYEKTQKVSDGLFTKEKLSLPLNGIYFDNKYETELATELYYGANFVNYESLPEKAYISTADLSSVVVNTPSIGLSTEMTKAEAYEVAYSNVSEDHLISGVTLRNQQSRTYLGVNGSSVTDGNKSPQEFELKTAKGGGYYFKIGKSYIDFSTGNLVSDEESATAIDLYSVATLKQEDSHTIQTPTLKAPTATLDLTATNRSVATQVKYKDEDKTFLYSNNIPKIKINLYDDQKDELVKSIDYDGKNSQEFSDLLSQKAYSVELIGTINLQDGNSDKEITLVSRQAITTKASTEPKLTVTLSDIAATGLTSNFTITDPDKTFVQKSGKEDIVVNFYKDNGTTINRQVQYQEKSQKITGLESNTSYRVEVIGTYNLNVGSADVQKKYHESMIKTLPAPAELNSAKLSWSTLYDNQGLTASIDFSDKDNTLDNLKHKLYELPNGVEYTSDAAQMQELLKENELIYENVSKDKNIKFALKDSNGKQKLFSNKSYVMITSFIKEGKETAEASTLVKTTAPETIKWSVVTDSLSPEVIVSFSYSDTEDYLIGGAEKKISYELVDRFGKTVTEGDFNVKRTGVEQLNLGELDKDTYTLHLRSTYNLLDGGGDQEWHMTSSLVVGSGDITLDSFMVDYQNNQLEVSVKNLMVSSEVGVETIKLQLYKLVDVGMLTEREEFVEGKEIETDNSFPMDINESFNLANREDGYYFVRLEIIQTSGEVFEKKTIAIKHTKTKQLNMLLNTTNKDGVITTNIRNKKLVAKDEIYTIELEDEYQNIIEEQQVSGKKFKKWFNNKFSFETKLSNHKQVTVKMFNSDHELISEQTVGTY